MATKKEDFGPRPSQADDVVSVGDLLDEVEEADRAATQEPQRTRRQYKNLRYIRMVVLGLFWLAFTILLFVTKDADRKWHGTAVPINGKNYPIQQQPIDDELTLLLKGPFQEQLTDLVEGKIKPYPIISFHEKRTVSDNKLIVKVQRTFKNEKNIEITEDVSKILSYELIEPMEFNNLSMAHIQREYIFRLRPSTKDDKDEVYFYNFQVEGVDRAVPLQLKSFPTATKTPVSIVLSALVVVGMFVLFFWDVISRGIVAMLFSTFTVGLMGLYEHRVPLNELLFYVEFDVILLVFGLTLIVAIFTESNAAHFLAVQAYRVSNGHIWPVLTVMCSMTAFAAAFLDNTTILILLTSFSIRLCEIFQLNPTSVLTCLILFSNTGYMLTKTGLAENAVLSQRGVIDHDYTFIDYGYYMLQMLLPVILSMGWTYIYLRIYYGNSAKMRIVEPPIISRLRHAIMFWQRTAQSVAGYTKEESALRENMLSKAFMLRKRLRRLGKMPLPAENFEENLKQLEKDHPIRNKITLIMSSVVLVAVVIMQICHDFGVHYLTPGWVCLLSALVLLALVDWENFDMLMLKIDWSTLITIACLYIISRALKPLGLIDAIGKGTIYPIKDISRRFRLPSTVITLLIVTTFAAAFTEPSYVCYVMASKAVEMAHDETYDLPLEPLLLAVLLGSGYGMNATLVSSMSNIVCAGIAEKHGFKFYFWDFFKVGVVVTLGNIAMAIIYLLIFNAVFGYK